MWESDGWPRIAVVGAGAVGCYFGGMLARAGAPVTLIGRAALVEHVSRDGLFIDGIHFQEKIPVSASADLGAVRGAELVLLCVKTVDTEEAARSLVPLLASGAVLLSLQNGVDNVTRIHAAAGIEAFAAAVYVAAEMSGPGRVRHTGRGDLIVGDLLKERHGDGRTRDLEGVAALFARAGVPCRTSENIEGELWVKLIMNCAYNAISALGRARYGRIAASPWACDVMRQATEETLAVARAEGVRVPDADYVKVVCELGGSMSDALSSTAQDIARGKRTEIDSLNGYVARRGAELGVAVPVNQTLHALVKLLENATPAILYLP